MKEPEGFESFHEREQDGLFGALCLITGDRYEAEEVAQLRSRLGFPTGTLGTGVPVASLLNQFPGSSVEMERVAIVRSGRSARRTA